MEGLVESVFKTIEHTNSQTSCESQGVKAYYSTSERAVLQRLCPIQTLANCDHRWPLHEAVLVQSDLREGWSAMVLLEKIGIEGPDWMISARLKEIEEREPP